MLSCIAKKFNVFLPDGRLLEVDAVLYGRKLPLNEEDDLWVVENFEYEPIDETMFSAEDIDFIESFIENEVHSVPHNFDPGVIPINQDPYDLEEVPDEFCAMQANYKLKTIRL